MRRCRQGDTAAFEEVYRTHAPPLQSAAPDGRAESDAEDLLQDVFLQAYRKLESFRGDSSLGTWLYRLAVNQCLDFLRGRQARMARATELARGRRRAGAGVSGAGHSGSHQPRRSRARDGPAAGGCRLAFVLHDVEGFAHHEVAAMLGISEGTSKSQVHKARLKLRSMLSAAVR